MTNDDLVTIASYRTPVEAELAKGQLESEGVRAVLGNELATGIMPFLPSGGGGLGGVTLQVLPEDVERAKEILGP